MKKANLLILLLITLACNQRTDQKTTEADTAVVRDSVFSHDTILAEKSPAQVYSNERFKDVTVERLANDQYVIKGKAQVFEAALSWVVEDGHNELKQGFATTDAGAPAWGSFEFTVEVSKERQNSTLHLILFEASAKDGSRQHELPVLLN